VRTLPAVSALRAAYPEARITWLVEPAAAGVLRGQPFVDDVREFPRPVLRASLRGLRPGRAARVLAGFLRELRAARFDLVLDFHGILKSGLLAFASGAPVRAGYARPFAREGAWLLANARARLSGRRGSRFERNDALVRFLAVDAPADPRPLRVDPEAEARVAAQLGSGPAPVVLHPGTSPGTPHKRWPAARYARLARALARRHEVACVVSAGPDPTERAAAREVVAASAGAARLAPPTEGLAELAALFSRARLYVGGDTGPMHVAALVGTPVVQILGPTHPVENAPWPGVPSRTVRTPVGCSPCRRGCAAALCMRLVAGQAVLEAASALLEAPAGALRREAAAPSGPALVTAVPSTGPRS